MVALLFNLYWGVDKGVHIFTKDISLKVNVTEFVEFQLD